MYVLVSYSVHFLEPNRNQCCHVKMFYVVEERNPCDLASTYLHKFKRFDLKELLPNHIFPFASTEYNCIECTNNYSSYFFNYNNHICMLFTLITNGFVR